MSTDLDQYNYMLKEYYTPERIRSLSYGKCPLLAMLKKNSNAMGSTIIQPVKYANTPNIGGDASIVFGSTGAGMSGTKGTKFVLERASQYGAVNLYRHTLKASKGSAGAFKDHMTFEVDGLREKVCDEVSQATDGMGTGGDG